MSEFLYKVGFKCHDVQVYEYEQNVKPRKLYRFHQQKKKT